MGNLIKKAKILLVVFLMALIGYFVWSSVQHEEENLMYDSIEDADLPVAYVKLYDRRMNALYGFVQDKSSCAGRGDLTVLPQDRCLPVIFASVDSPVKGIQYEIRSLDGEHLVERTSLKEWTMTDGEVYAQLPIQNLLAEGEEYRLTLAIATETHKAVYYYTRIVWMPENAMEEMVQLAVDFSEKTFQYQTARELTTYLESDLNADNSSLGEVTLKNNFDQLTWRSLGIERIGEPELHIRELQGSTGTVNLEYIAALTTEEGHRNYYEVSEAFTMRWSAQRIYMMDYNRRMNQIFSGETDLYSEKRIMLGISDAENIQTMTDASGKFHAFVANRALWCYDAENGESTKVFAFQTSEEELLAGFQSHGVELLAVSEDGVIDFLVYGYMNRGNHEGTTGVAVYRYESQNHALTERMYLPSSLDYESLCEDIKTLSFLNGSQNLYLMMDHAVYAVDLIGKEYMAVADGLTEENFAVSTDHSRIAWQDGERIYASERLNVMDLETGKKDQIEPQGETVIRLIGFVGNDLVYGLAHFGEQFVSDGRVTGIPLYAIEIMGTSMELETRYEKQGVYLKEVNIQESRIHLERVGRMGDGYFPLEEDTLVCNDDVVYDPLSGIGHLADAAQGRLYFVQLDGGISRSRNIRINVPKRTAAEENNVILLQENHPMEVKLYYAYSRGRLAGIYADFASAVQASYEGMGLVTDNHGRVCWSRIDRSSMKTIRDMQTKTATIRRYLAELADGRKTASDGTELIDARGLTLNQTLYFISEGMPVTAYLGDGSYGLIYGYDTYNISWLRNPGQEDSAAEKMGLNDAAAFFERNGGNDFICFLSGEEGK